MKAIVKQKQGAMFPIKFKMNKKFRVKKQKFNF